MRRHRCRSSSLTALLAGAFIAATVAFGGCRPDGAAPPEALAESGDETPSGPSESDVRAAFAAARSRVVVPEPPPPPAAEPGVFAALCPEPPDGMACVRGGWFERGIDEDVDGCVQTGIPPEPASEPAAEVWIDTFYIDRTEVTNAAYRACVEAGACRSVGPLYRGFSADDQPHTGGSWFDARDYCEWTGGRLPTEAEWEAAARGPDGDRTPFGDELVTCDEAVVMDDRGRSCGVPQPSSQPEKGVVLAVASRPAGHYGLYDMVGNAEEWVADWWTPRWDACGDDCAGLNPRGPCDGADDCPGHRQRAVRGGSWYWGPECATGYHRRRYRPDNDPPHHYGFRCARDIERDGSGGTGLP